MAGKKHFNEKNWSKKLHSNERMIQEEKNERGSAKQTCFFGATTLDQKTLGIVTVSKRAYYLWYQAKGLITCGTKQKGLITCGTKQKGLLVVTVGISDAQHK
jgi:hypothetical protein